MLSLRNAKRFMGSIRFQKGSEAKIPQLIRKKCIISSGKKRQGFKRGIREKNCTLLEKMDKK